MPAHKEKAPGQFEKHDPGALRDIADVLHVLTIGAYYAMLAVS